MMKKLNKKAFTLIELLVVVVVIGILVLLGAPKFTGYTQKAELTRIQHDIKVMEQEVGTVLSTDDDDFNKWGNNNKDLSQLIQEGKLFEKEGVVVDDVESIDGPYKVIPKEYKDKINTKLKGTFYANSGGKVYYEHGKSLSGIPTEPEEKEPGVPVDPEKPAEPVEEETVEKEPVYSDEEIEGLIKEGYIPISTAKELNNVRNGLDKKYIQVANINLSEYSGSGWDPIGALSEEALKGLSEGSEDIDFTGVFTGTYDGGNYVITGLKTKGGEYQGLFGYIAGAAIRNVGLINNTARGGDGWRGNIGGLVGWADSSTIENSYSTGSVDAGSSTRVGGLVGMANNTKISNSYTTGPVTGRIYVGGLVGQADENSTISKSYATGEVKGTANNTGGLVGRAYGTKISNSYAIGSVTGARAGSYVGGLVGEAGESTKISNSYAAGEVAGNNRVGGLVGYADDSSTISHSYWDEEATRQNRSADKGEGKSEGKTTEDMKKQSTYLNWNFVDVWKIDEGVSYPTLR